MQQSHNYPLKAVNVELIYLYRNVGAYIREKPAVAEWGDRTARELVTVIQKKHQELKGFNLSGIYGKAQ